MLEKLFSNVLTEGITASNFFLCTVVSLALGLLIAVVYLFRNRYTKSFVVTLALLPPMVQIVILLVNGNLGAGLAVAGAFSLIRFRSAPGTAKEIGMIFLAMTAGLATGSGYVGLAVVFTVMLCAVFLLYSLIPLGEKKGNRELRITIPESLDYTEIFDDLFAQYTRSHTLNKVKTTNMGSLYQLHYSLELKNENQEKQFLDALRCRNGNLEITCGRPDASREEL